MKYEIIICRYDTTPNAKEARAGGGIRSVGREWATASLLAGQNHES